MTEVISSVKCISLKNKSARIQHIIEGMTHFKSKYPSSWDLCGWTLVHTENEESESKPYILYKNHCCHSISFQAVRQKAQAYCEALFRRMERIGGSFSYSFDSVSLKKITEDIFNKSESGYEKTIDTSKILPLGLEDHSEGFYSKKFDVTYSPCETNPDKRLFREEITNFDAMCAFFGVMIKGGPNHQYLWIYGKGSVGKTILINSIAEHIDHSFIAETTIDKFSDRFFASKIYNKRLIICEEGDATDMSSNALKRLVGDGRLMVEKKFENDAKVVKNQAMVIVISNDLPNVKLDEATRRRIIFCHFPDITKEKFMDNAASEMRSLIPKFLGYCVHKAETHVDSLGIKADYTEYEKIAFDEVENWIDALRAVLVFNVESTIESICLRRIIKSFCFAPTAKVTEKMISDAIIKIDERLGGQLKKHKTENGIVWKGAGSKIPTS